MNLTYPRHVYQARTERIVDGDSVNVLPLPAAKLRLLGFDAAELRGGTEESRFIAGLQTKWVASWLATHTDLVIDSRGTDSFGRELAWIYDRTSGECLNFDFVREWPDTATNPRFQGERATGVTTSRSQYKPYLR